MAPAYKNVNSGQVVVSDGPRPDLESLARWVEVPVPEAVEPTGTPGETGQGDDEDSSDETERPAGTPDAETATAGQGGEIISDDPNGEPVVIDGEPIEGDAATQVPDETWTDEQLDALAEQRGIKYRSNASKATKLAKLTE